MLHPRLLSEPASLIRMRQHPIGNTFPQRVPAPLRLFGRRSRTLERLFANDIFEEVMPHDAQTDGRKEHVTSNLSALHGGVHILFTGRE